MAIYDHFSPSGNYDASKLTVMRAVIDFKKRPLASGDDLRVIKIEAGTLIFHSQYKVRTAEGAALTCDIGTAQGGTQIVSNLNCNSAGSDYTEGTIKFSGDVVTELDSDGYIWVNADGAADKAVVDLMLVVCKNNQNVIAAN